MPPHTVNGNHNRKGLSKTSGDGLVTAIKKLWPTMSVGTCGGGKMGGGSGGWKLLVDGVGIEDARKMGSGNGGLLNADWIEMFMGFLVGWTDPKQDDVEPWQGWPSLMGEEQHDYEPPRLRQSVPFRRQRLKALGNAVVPVQALPFFHAIAAINKDVTR